MSSSPKGLRLLKALEIAQKRPCFDSTTVLNKVNLQSASKGVLKGSFIVDSSMCNQGGTIHGGYIAVVVDVFSFYSLLSNPDGRVSWTTSVNISYVGSAKEGETVNVETNSLKIGNSSIVETYLHSGRGNLLAKGSATFTAGNEKYQQLFKELFNFDVYEN